MSYIITAQGTYNSSAPTLSNGNSSALQLDVNGNLFVRLSAETTKVIGTVNVAASQTIAVTNAGTFLVQAELQGHAGVTLDAVLGATKPANALQVGGNDGTNAYGIPLASGGGTVLVHDASPSSQAVTNAGTFAVQASIAASQTIAVTNVGTFAVQASIAASQTIAATNAGTFAVQATPAPGTSGGYSAWDIFGNTLTDSSQEVKSSAGQFYGYTFFNPNTVTVYLMIYSASETCGSATNRVFCIGIPAGAGANDEFANGIACGTTIYAAISTAVNSAAAPSTQCVGTLFYK
jgi:hypothetical protein